MFARHIASAVLMLGGIILFIQYLSCNYYMLGSMLYSMNKMGNK